MRRSDPVVALERGINHDPFGVLGPHQTKVDGAPALIVRFFHPEAEAVELVAAALAAPVRLARRPGTNLFEGVVSGWAGEPQEFDYRLRVTWKDGRSSEVDDAYRFGRILSDFDLHLISEGTQLRAHEKLGAQATELGPMPGVHFAVWAPNADRVSVVGDFNRWDGRVHPMRRLMPHGVWEIFIPGIGRGEKYKFEIRSRRRRRVHEGRSLRAALRAAAAVGVGRLGRRRLRVGRRVVDGGARRAERLARSPDVGLRSAPRVVGSCRRRTAIPFIPRTGGPAGAVRRDMGFTHIELLPMMEHPFDGSWGYQVVGFFAPTSRLGEPDDFKAFVDACHQAGIGVLLDWVPGHFPKDAHGLARFDGTALYEHEDPRKGEQLDWGTLVFNYGRNEVRSFLLSNALFWLEQYHIDGLRVDAVASMLYLDYSREAGQWVANRYGGRENLEAIDFLRALNTLTHGEQPGSITIAEESTSWPGVSRPVHLGGLGFTFKWNMGWMHDILSYMRHDPIHRRWAHNNLTFSMLYAYHENFVLPFSHDEVVHLKGSMIGKMAGDSWQKAANLRALYGFLFGHPGKKLMFMGSEFGQWPEWNHDRGLEWAYVDQAPHRGIRQLVKDLNRLYRAEPALHRPRLRSRRLPVDRLQRPREQRRVVHPPRARSARLPHRGPELHAGRQGRLRGRRAGAGRLPRDDQHRRRDLRRVEPGQRRRVRVTADLRARTLPPAAARAATALVPDPEEERVRASRPATCGLRPATCGRA